LTVRFWQSGKKFREPCGLWATGFSFLEGSAGNVIQLENISKEYKSKKGTIRAVNDVSLHVKKGEIHGVIGYSGTGKST